MQDGGAAAPRGTRSIVTAHPAGYETVAPLLTFGSRSNYHGIWLWVRRRCCMLMQQSTLIDKLSTVTEAEMMEALEQAVVTAGGVRAFARLADTQPSYVSRALRDPSLVGPKLLTAAGIERIVTYRRVG